MDVDRFLEEETSPEAFDEFVAMNQIVPFGDEKIAIVFATGLSLIIDRLNRLIKSFSGQDNPEVKPKDLIPWLKKNKKKRSEYVNPNAAAAALKVALSR